MKILNQIFLKNIKYFGKISSNWPKDLGTNVCNTLDLCWQLSLTILQCTNTTPVTYKLGTFSPFLFFVIFLLVLPSNIIVSGVQSSR